VDIYDNDGKYKQISWCADDELIYDHLIDWIVSLEDDVPFFGFLLPMNSHHPFWTPKNEYKIIPETDKKSQYINALRYQDYLVGKLFKFLERTNKLKDTIVIITGDHGTVFNSLNQNGRNQSLYLMDKSTVQVPCYIYIPFKKLIKLETEIIGSHVDIMPTILDFLGIEIEDQIQGRSLFDPKIRERISFIYTDYYRHTVTGLTSNFYLMRDMTEDLTILSKSLNFRQNYCDDNKELCELIRGKVDDFDKYQNQRLYSYFR
jgi:membrane-anchored protein YejM (alkaline phosphatase superfamily)